MQIRNLINESDSNLMLRFRDLNSLQVAVLKRILNGRLALDTATPREQQVVDELEALGLVDSMSFELTQDGERMAQLGSKYGSFQTKEAGRRDDALGRKPFTGKRRGYDDMGDDVDVDDVAPVHLRNVREPGALAGVSARDDV